MRNLAGLPTDEANAAIVDELATAGIDAVPVPLDTRTREVRSTVDGVLRVGAHTFTFRRAWVYWVVDATPDLTVDEAVCIDERPPPNDDGTKYSGARGCLGDVARWSGFAGGISPREYRHGRGWHVDTQAGLVGLVEALTAQFGGAA